MIEVAEFAASEHLKDLLATHVGTSGWAIEIGTMPSTPDRVIKIMDTGGDTPNPKWLLDFPSCQVMVRGNASGYLDTFREAKAVKDILLGVDSQDINGDRLVAVNMQGDLGSIGRDEDMRHLFSMNFSLIIEPQVVSNSNRQAL
ncbi:MAG: minor capsid protein [Dehalococcoidales bacterium]